MVKVLSDGQEAIWTRRCSFCGLAQGEGPDSTGLSRPGGSIGIGYPFLGALRPGSWLEVSNYSRGDFALLADFARYMLLS